MTRQEITQFILDEALSINENGDAVDEDQFARILTQLRNQMQPKLKPTSKKVLNSLEKIKITEEMSTVTCAICQCDIQVGETAIKLPCKTADGAENPHWFHDGSDKEQCGGITEWLKDHNTCPICRYEFEMETTKKRKRVDSEDNIDFFLRLCNHIYLQ